MRLRLYSPAIVVFFWAAVILVAGRSTPVMVAFLVTLGVSFVLHGQVEVSRYRERKRENGQS